MTQRPRLSARSVVLIFGVVTLMGLSACTSADGDAGSGTPDTLTVAVPELPVGIDPIAHNTAGSQMVYKLVTEALYRYTGPDEISPELAAEMPEVSEDGKTWTIKLKKGVTFSNGDPLDADDVVYTFEQIMDPENGSNIASLLAALDSVQALDNHTVELKLSYAFTPMMYQLTRLSITTSSIDYVPGETYATTLVGTGPYKISKIERGQEIHFEANEEFRIEGVPAIPKLVIKSYPDNNSRLLALRNGQVDAIPQLSPSAVATVEEFADVYQSESDMVASRYWLWPNINGELMSDQRVREAVAVAIDRGRVVDNVFRGYGYPLSTLPAAREGGSYHSELADSYGSEPQTEAAQALLEQAGVEGQTLHIVAPIQPGTTEVADSVQQQLEAIGFKIKREDLTPAAAVDRLFDGNYDLYLNSASSAAGQPGLDSTYCLFRTKGTCNFNGVADKDLDRIALEAVKADDPTQVIEEMRRAQLAYVPAMLIGVQYDLMALSKDVDGFEMYNYADYTGFAYAKKGSGE